MRGRCNGLVQPVELKFLKAESGMNELSFKDGCRRFQLFAAENWNEEKEVHACGVVNCCNGEHGSAC